jgi:N-acetylglutamate synthase-like GNAT family acetyltransferase
VSAVAVAPLRVVGRHAAARVTRPSAKPALVVRPATAADADAIHALIARHVTEGHLLPRTRDEIAAHVSRFVIALEGDSVVACADLAPLGRAVSEVRSLVVAAAARARGIGRRLVDDLKARAAAAGGETLVAFTHSPGYFLQMGFSIVPHVSVPEKIEKDCRACAQFRHCGQYAVALPLVRSRALCVPLASLHG